MSKAYTIDIIIGDESLYRGFKTKEEASRAYDLLESFYTSANIKIELTEDKNGKVIRECKILNEDGK